MSPYQPYAKVINHPDYSPSTRSPRKSGRPIAHYSLMPPSIPPHHPATRISSAPVGPPRLVRLPPPTPPPSQPLPRPQPLRSHPLHAIANSRTNTNPPPSPGPPSPNISSPGLSPSDKSTPTTTTTTPSLTPEQVDKAVQAVLSFQTEATNLHSKPPSAAILLGPDKRTILLSHFAISHVRHAESELARLAVDHFSTSYLSGCTLVSTWEPCAMCAGTIYWSGIGSVVYVASQAKLKEAAGSGSNGNSNSNSNSDSDGDSDSEQLLLPGVGLSLACRTVFRAGPQRQVDVIGPVPEWEDRVVDESAKWWKQQQQQQQHEAAVAAKPKGRSKSTTKTSSATGNEVIIWTGEDSVLSSIGEDGEYKAELDIDWMR